MRKNNIYLCLAMIIACLSACGVYSFTGASISPDIKTVSIAYFPNQASTIQPALSQIFTEKMKDKFVSQTTLTMTNDPGDLQFDGAIVDYFTQPMAIQGNEQAALNRLTINVKVRFVNTKDEKQNFESVFSRFTDYDSRKSLASVENELMNDVCSQLVDDIFNKAVINW